MFKLSFFSHSIGPNYLTHSAFKSSQYNTHEALLIVNFHERGTIWVETKLAHDIAWLHMYMYDVVNLENVDRLPLSQLSVEIHSDKV